MCMECGEPRSCGFGIWPLDKGDARAFCRACHCDGQDRPVERTIKLVGEDGQGLLVAFYTEGGADRGAIVDEGVWKHLANGKTGAACGEDLSEWLDAEVTKW